MPPPLLCLDVSPFFSVEETGLTNRSASDGSALIPRCSSQSTVTHLELWLASEKPSAMKPLNLFGILAMSLLLAGYSFWVRSAREGLADSSPLPDADGIPLLRRAE